MKTLKIGLLPLYLELYDRCSKDCRPEIERFYAQVADQLSRHGVEVLRASVCRLALEFEAAVRSFEHSGACAIVTLHLAYSPSLESARALASSRLPVIVLDTTPDFEFGPRQKPDRIMYNHGIHGVQDMCNLLLRNGKTFAIEAGHWLKSDVLARVAAKVRGAAMAATMRSARVGRLGEPFRGMGDFQVSDREMASDIGLKTVRCDWEELRRLTPAADSSDVEKEMREDRLRFDTRGVDPELHRRSVRAGLAVRRWIETRGLTAFTFNFLALDSKAGLPTMPFLEASKGMARGIGYAGEGDALTAGLVGAIASVRPETSFVEMFCPDWKGNSVFLSHMGEFNPNLACGKARMREHRLAFTDIAKPAQLVGSFKPGKAVYVDLAPLGKGRYNLIVAPGVMLPVRGKDELADTVHGWFRSAMPVADFLAAYSRAGGTHHSALVYGETEAELCAFGEFMGWNIVRIDALP